MPAPIQIDAFDTNARSVTFTAYGQQKTISGLGEFETKAALLEYLQAVAESDMKTASAANPLPDFSSFVGSTLETAEDVGE